MGALPVPGWPVCRTHWLHFTCITDLVLRKPAQGQSLSAGPARSTPSTASAFTAPPTAPGAAGAASASGGALLEEDEAIAELLADLQVALCIMLYVLCVMLYA